MDTIEVAMGLIMHAGNARSFAMEAIQAIRDEKDYELALKRLDEAEEAIAEAHKVQTSLLVAEAQEQEINITILLIHSQDHLMNAITVIDLAKEIVNLYNINK